MIVLVSSDETFSWTIWIRFIRLHIAGLLPYVHWTIWIWPEHDRLIVAWWMRLNYPSLLSPPSHFSPDPLLGWPPEDTWFHLEFELAIPAIWSVMTTWLDRMLSSNWPSSTRTEQLLITIDSSLVSDFPLSLDIEIAFFSFSFFLSSLSALMMHNDTLLLNCCFWFPQLCYCMRSLVFLHGFFITSWLLFGSGLRRFGLTFVVFPSRMAGLGHAVFTWLAIALICFFWCRLGMRWYPDRYCLNSFHSFIHTSHINTSRSILLDHYSAINTLV